MKLYLIAIFALGIWLGVQLASRANDSEERLFSQRFCARALQTKLLKQCEVL